LKQAICRELINQHKKNTIQISQILYFLIKLYNIIACITNKILKKLLVLVNNFFYYYNPQITNTRILKFKIYKSAITLNCWLSMLVGISEAIRLLFLNSINLILNYSTYNLNFIKNKLTRNISNNKQNKTNIKFNQWLAGLIDGDGSFLLTKKGYASLEITMDVRDKSCLNKIKQKFGGSIKLRSGVKAVRYRLHHKKGLLDLINAVNGEIRNPVRLLQLNKICEKYNINLIQPSILTYNNGWLSGFFDSDGSIYLNLNSPQVIISVAQKNNYTLNTLLEIYGGNIHFRENLFKWIVTKRSEIINLLNYFKEYPSRSAKINRLKAINKYYELKDLKAHNSAPNSILGKAWRKFLLKWSKWEKVGK